MTAFFNSVSVGVLITTSDGRVMEANPTFVNMLKFQDALNFRTIDEASDALVGVDFRRFIHSRDQQRFDTLLK
jgi:PAS domain-containing protein